jgi:nicotinate-nucleotide adenylyltransferase
MGLRPVTGVLGGTFDPIHLGHLHVAEQAAAILGLGTVLLMPSARPPHKATDLVTGNRHRLNMLHLAVATRPGLEVSTLEYDRRGLSYTIDTLRSLRSGHRPVDPVFLIGGDALAELHTWKEYRSILIEFDLAVIRRPQDPRDRDRLDPEVRRRLVDYPVAGLDRQPPPGHGGRIFRLDVDPVPISSTTVRRTAALEAPIRGLVPLSVAKYIQDHQLYRREAQP